MLEAARAREREAEAEAQLGGSTAAAAAAAAEGQEREDAQEEGEAEEPLLRVQVVTLAPCVSNYTLGFLRDMAFNITEGQTYTGALSLAVFRMAVAAQGLWLWRSVGWEAAPLLALPS